MDVSGTPSQSPARPKRKPSAPASAATVDPSALIGKRLGRYAITGQLGRGGMGIVYQAEDTRLQRKVAIKLLPEEVSSNPDALARFLREAQGAARLNHANVVAVYDIGEARGTHYIVMELINGGSAQDSLRARGPFHWAEATSILMDVCRGVAAAHKAGLIHRDIKPSNVLRSADGVVKLGDFGLVKPTGIKGTDVTALGEMIGTPHYMSPEQGRCNPLDERTDIYSLGATYFALLTGRPPFNSPDSMQVLFAHCAHPVPDPAEIVRGIPEQCTAIIRKAMEKNRAQRHARVGELLADLEQVLALSAGSDTTPAPQTRPFVWGAPPETDNAVSLAPAYPGERSETTRRPSRRKLIGISVLGSLGLAAVVAGVARPWAKRQPQPQPQPQPPPAAQDDWPAQAADAEKAIRARNAPAMKRALESVRVMQQRPDHQEPARREAIRQASARLEKALAFRESITERGLVLGIDSVITGLVVSPDDRWIAIGQAHGDAGAFVFDSYTGEKRYTLWPRRGQQVVRVQALSFDRDSTTLAAVTADTSVRVSDIVSGKESALDAGPGVKRVLAVAFSPASRNLVAGFEAHGEGKGKPYLKVWNLDTRKEPFAFKAEHSSHVASVAFTAGGHQVVTGSHDNRVVMWNAETGRIWRELRCGNTVRAMACSPQGRTIAVSTGEQDKPVLQFWDYAGETRLATEPSPHGPCACVAFSRNGALLASGSGSRVLLWNAETRTLLATLSGHSQLVTSVAFVNEGGILVTGSGDQTTRLWDVTRHLPNRSAP